MKNQLLSLLCVVFLFAVSSCDETPQPKESTKVEKGEPDKKEVSSSAGGNMLKFQNQLFSIPSPIQTAILIRKQNIEYNSDMVSSLKNADSYLTENKKALNLGVLGSDLAYMSNYNDMKMSLNCLGQIENLAEQLNIKANIDPMLFKRFNENIDKPDSLNMLNSAFYKNMERYLKDNSQNELSALILTGGWVESMYFATQNSSNEFLRTRVAEQKNSVSNVKSLLSGYDDELVKNIAKKFEAVESAFKGSEMSYEYEKPITDPKSKMTYIKSKSSVKLTDDQLEKIKSSIAEIRNLIIS